MDLLTTVDSPFYRVLNQSQCLALRVLSILTEVTIQRNNHKIGVPSMVRSYWMWVVEDLKSSKEISSG
jgi:hypothetical protein